MAIRGLPRPEKYVNIGVYLSEADAQALSLLGAPMRASLGAMARVALSMLLNGETVTRATWVQRYKELHEARKQEAKKAKGPEKPKRPRGRPRKEGKQ